MSRITLDDAKAINILLLRAVSIVSAEQKLWLAVIQQSILDISLLSRQRKTGAPSSESNTRVAHTCARKAISWVFYSDSFGGVCELAGIEPGYVHSLFKDVERYKALV